MGYIKEEDRTPLQRAVIEKLENELREKKEYLLSLPKESILNLACDWVNGQDYVGAFERNLNEFDEDDLQIMLKEDSLLAQFYGFEQDDSSMIWQWHDYIEELKEDAEENN